MQRFTLIHDGSSEAWQTAYMAFHIAARLGAPLQVLLVDSVFDEETIAQRATDIEVGGRAAGVVIESHPIMDLTSDSLVESTAVVDGLFVPRRLVPDEKTAIHFLEALSCPLWIVPKETETHRMAVLVGSLSEEEVLTSAAILSQRLGGYLKGIVLGDSLPAFSDNGVDLEWISLGDASGESLDSTIKRIQADLLFVHVSRLPLIPQLSCTCVVYPRAKNA